MTQYIVTAMAEYYAHVEASSAEEAIAKAKEDQVFSRTMNYPMQDFRAAAMADPGSSVIRHDMRVDGVHYTMDVITPGMRPGTRTVYISEWADMEWRDSKGRHVEEELAGIHSTWLEGLGPLTTENIEELRSHVRELRRDGCTGTKDCGCGIR